MKILIVVNKANPAAQDASLLLMTYLASQGIDYISLDSHNLPSSDVVYGCDEAARLSWETDSRFNPAPDMAVVLGGDGTILRTARLAAVFSMPIVGINFGHLGFLANSSEPGVIGIVAAALAGEATVHDRTNLRIDVVCEGDEASGRPPRSFFALNEIAIARGTSGSIVNFSMSVSGEHVAAMRGDGLVVSSATGSTAYALSVGGPLVAPGYRGLVVVPIAPHTLTSRAIVTEPNDVVEVDLAVEENRGDVTLFVDGEALKFDAPIHQVIMRRGEHPTTLLYYQQEDFYQRISRTFF